MVCLTAMAGSTRTPTDSPPLDRRHSPSARGLECQGVQPPSARPVAAAPTPQSQHLSSPGEFCTPWGDRRGVCGCFYFSGSQDYIYLLLPWFMVVPHDPCSTPPPTPIMILTLSDPSPFLAHFHYNFMEGH